MKPIRYGLCRLRSFLLAGRIRRSIDAEISSHIEEDTARLRDSGLGAAEAERLAMHRFGDPQRVARELRELAMINEPGKRRHGGSMWLDLRQAGRALRRAPGFTVTVALTLGLAVGANAAMISVTRAVILGTGGVTDADRVAAVYMFYDFLPEALREQPVHPSRLPLIADLEAVRYAAGFKSGFFNLTRDGSAKRLEGMLTTPDLMRVAGTRPAIGPGFQDITGGTDKVVVISWELFTGELGSRGDVIGSTLTLNSEPYEIVGVMPRGFAFPRGSDVPETFRFPERPDLWVPYDLPERGPSDLGVVVRLERGYTVAQLRAQLTAAQQEAPENIRRFMSFRAIGIQEQATGPLRPLVAVLLAATTAVLLVAAGNVAGVILARSTGRSRELAIRRTLGAGTSGVVRYLLAESLWLGAATAVIALPLATLFTGVIRVWAPTGIPGLYEIGLSNWTVVLAVSLAFVASAGCGLAALPAIKGGSALRESTRTTGSRSTRRIGRLIVGGEIAFTLVLLATAGMLSRSLSNLMSIDPGFDPEGVLTAEVTLPESVYPDAERATRVQRARPPARAEAAVPRFHRRLLERLRSIPGVTGAAVVRPLPMSGQQEGSVYWIEGTEASGEGSTPIVEYTVVSDGYFETLAIPVKRGSDFPVDLRHDDEPVAVVNEALAEQFPDGVALNARIKLGGAPDAPYPWLRVIGVVGNIKRAGVTETPGPELYVHMSQGGYTTLSTMHLVVKGRGAAPADLVPQVRAALGQIDPAVPLDRVTSMQSLVADSVARNRFLARLMIGFATLSLVIAGVGLYSVISYSVVARAREFALKKALGATEQSVLAEVVTSTGAVLAAGLLLGMAGAVAAGRFLEALLFGVAPLDPRSFGIAALMLAAVSAAAALYPAFRILRLEPASVLQSE